MLKESDILAAVKNNRTLLDLIALGFLADFNAKQLCCSGNVKTAAAGAKLYSLTAIDM